MQCRDPPVTGMRSQPLSLIHHIKLRVCLYFLQMKDKDQRDVDSLPTVPPLSQHSLLNIHKLTVEARRYKVSLTVSHCVSLCHSDQCQWVKDEEQSKLL